MTLELHSTIENTASPPPQSGFATPVLLVVFNRLYTVQQSLKILRQIQVRHLLVFADGPRSTRPDEAAACADVRNFILNNIDWPCTLETKFLPHNVGCRAAVSGAVSWFFSKVPEGIILEDDCQPVPDFFRFAAQALEFYRDNPQIMHINGTAHTAPPAGIGDACSYFYRYAHVWGWASWRRAWQHYDGDLENWKETETANYFPGDLAQARRWNEILRHVKNHASGFDTWDFQWTYSIIQNSGWVLAPRCNLIRNIGSEQSTHEMKQNLLNLPAGSLPEKLIFPQQRLSETAQLEQQIYQMSWAKPGLLQRLVAKIKRTFK